MNDSKKTDKAEIQKGALNYRLFSEDILFKPKSKFSFYACLNVSLDNETHALEIAKKYSLLNPKSEIRKSKSRWGRIFFSLPDPGKLTDNITSLYHHCVMTLLSNSYTSFGYSPWKKKSGFGAYDVTFPSRGRYSGVFLEDGSYQILGIKEWDVELAEGQALALLDNQNKDGSIPIGICLSPVKWADEFWSETPILTWACWKLYQVSKRKPFLEKIFNPLERYNHWWFSNRDRNRNGLCEWIHGQESGNDDSPRWDLEDDRQRIGAKELEAVDLNSFLVVQMKCLSKIASEIGKKNKARIWEEKAEELRERIVQNLYDSEDNLFYDLYYKTRKFKKILTPASFLPLWADVKLPEGKARKMIKRYLLNESSFWGKVPFPSVAYSEETYSPGKMWRGPTWITHSYFMLQILCKYGFYKEAENAVRKILKIVCGNIYIHECYHSRTGQGIGIPEYSWSAALLLEIILNRYKDPII